MKKRILSILLVLCMVLSIMPMSVLAEGGDKKYIVAGNENLFGSPWDATGTVNVMTQTSDNTYELTVTAASAVGPVYFKVSTVDWGESYGYADGNNIMINVTGPGEIKITFNSVTKEIGVSGDNVNTELPINSVTAVGNGVSGGKWLNGANWDPADSSNHLTKTSPKVYEITYNNITEADDYMFKFVINDGWEETFGGDAGSQTAVYDGNNIRFGVERDGSTVKLVLDLTNFDYATKKGAIYKLYVNGVQINITTLKASDFTFTPPSASDLTYDGNAKAATVTSTKSGVGDITVKYYDELGNKLDGAPKDAGTYTVKIDVAKSEAYDAVTDVTADSWKFTIDAKELQKDKFNVVVSDKEYDGTNAAKATIDYDGEALVYGTDYVFSAEYDDAEIGTDKTVTIVIFLDGNYVCDDGYAYATIVKQADITQGIPNARTQTTARVLRGGKLADATVTKGEIVNANGSVIEGELAWVDGTKVMNADGTEQMTFTPNAELYGQNYKTVTIDVAVSTYSASSGGGGGSLRYTVRFDTDGGNKIATQTIIKNNKATEPTAPTKDGYTFDGWYTDSKFKNEYDFDTKIAKSIILYAKWTENDAEKPSVDDNKDDEQNSTSDEWKNPFNDVKVSDWFFESVKYATENELMSGTSSTEFAPNVTLTRGMLVTILYRMEGEPAVNKSVPFADVATGSYYADAVIWAQQNGIVSGINDTEFAPEDSITREQIAVIIYRYAKLKGLDVSVGENTNILSYDDYDEISGYAIEAVQYAVGSGLLKGRTYSTFNPQDNAMRAEFAEILYRFDKMI